MTLLDKAILIAVEAHSGQKDRQGLPYILHPLRVMLGGKNEEERIVAVLHDVIEDTNVRFLDLMGHGFPQEVLDAILDLTHDDEIDYQEYIEDLAPNRLARAVKLLDLKDNMARKDSLGAPARARLMERYIKALAYLEAL